MLTMDSTCHTAHLDPMTGEGLLTLPRPSDDLLLSLGEASLHAADELFMLGRLDALG